MTTYQNSYLVNIIDIQNVTASITGNLSGAAAIAQLQTDVSNIQEMVEYTTKTILADTITNFTPEQTVAITNTATSSTTSSNTTQTGTLAFIYSTGGLTGQISGSLPSQVFVSTNIVASGTTITLTLTSTYSILNFPNYIGTIRWFNGTNYSSFTIPNQNVVSNDTQIIISNLTIGQLVNITPDSSGYSLWLSMAVFN